jgi:hypothetical protein
MSTTANDEIIPLQIVESKDDVFPDVESRPKSITKKKGKTKVKAKRSEGDILELTSEEEKKKLSRVKKMRHNSEDVDLKVVRIERTSKKEDSVSTNTADDRKCEKSPLCRRSKRSEIVLSIFDHNQGTFTITLLSLSIMISYLSITQSILEFCF